MKAAMAASKTSVAPPKKEKIDVKTLFDEEAEEDEDEEDEEEIHSAQEDLAGKKRKAEAPAEEQATGGAKKKNVKVKVEPKTEPGENPELASTDVVYLGDGSCKPRLVVSIANMSSAQSDAVFEHVRQLEDTIPNLVLQIDID